MVNNLSNQSEMVTIQFDSRLLVNSIPENIRVEKTTEHTIIIEVPAGKSVNQTLKDLNINLSQAVAAVVNGRSTDLEQPLEPGDQVRLLPQIAGGD